MMSAKKEVDKVSGAAHQKFNTLDEAKQAMKSTGHAHLKVFIKNLPSVKIPTALRAENPNVLKFTKFAIANLTSTKSGSGASQYSSNAPTPTGHSEAVFDHDTC